MDLWGLIMRRLFGDLDGDTAGEIAKQQDAAKRVDERLHKAGARLGDYELSVEARIRAVRYRRDVISRKEE